MSEGDSSATKGDILSDVCSMLERDEVVQAGIVLQEKYPFVPLENAGRRYSALQCLQIFLRDGFVDRYSGTRMVFPGTLRIISHRLPEAFPFHKNAKTDECHFAYWELLPTIDHLVPVSRGGPDESSNWVTTSMARNAAKANFTLEELGWSLYQLESLHRWDGLMTWFLKEIARDPSLLQITYIRRWYRAAQHLTYVKSEGHPI